MIESIVIEFERVTKFPLLDFLREYKTFMDNSYQHIDNYFSGKTETIDNQHISALKNITTKTKDAMAQFKNFANKFNSCGYWELMDIIDELNTTIEKINKLPKFRRTSLSKRGYTPTIEATATVGSLRTVEDVAEAVGGAGTTETDWISLMLNNDMNEEDWEIDKMSGMNVYIDNLERVVVNTIVDMPIGERVYGKDIVRKISFADNDFQLVQFQDNIEQKCTILLELNQGDVPENRLFGKNLRFLSENVRSFSYPEIVNDVRKTFLQNDLFQSVEMKDISFDGNGTAYMQFEIRTKYNYKSIKTTTV